VAGRTFTDTWLKGVKPGAKRQDFTESSKPGFMLRVWPGGEKTFVFRYQLAGKSRVMTLGQYDSTSLDSAHRAYEVARAQFKNKLDPIEEAKRAKAREEALAARRLQANAVTVRNVIAEWAWHYARRERKRPREAARLLRRYIGEPWKTRPVPELRRRDAVLLLDRIKGRAPVLANRVAALGKQAFGFAVKRDLIETNPFADIDPPGGEERSVERWLDDGEVRVFWRALDDAEIAPRVRLGLKLILVTAQRPGEVVAARFDQLADKAATWTIPAEIAKNGREHIVPLSPVALDLVSQLRELAGDEPYLLPARDARALSRALRLHLDDNGRLFGLAPFTPHDLRRTAASHMTSIGVPRLHVSKVLNHTDNETTAIYDRHAYLEEKRHALQVWSDELQAIVAGRKRKVVPIGKGARRG
jgi:integrase